MDDSDDDAELLARAAALKKSKKSKTDREADEAFRKAAAEDAKKDKGGSSKSGWLGGWLGGKGKEASGGPNVTKVTLPKNNSTFVYDAELKKWVNKDPNAPEPSPTSTATPPPPRGPPSRASSSNRGPSASQDGPTSNPMQLQSSLSPPLGSGPPSLPPSRNTSPALHGGLLSPTRGAGAVDGGATPSLPPGDGKVGSPAAIPSRPNTGTSNASSIDDLIGVPAARKGGTAKKGRKGRGYVDVMAK
jgi:hypothetical protein